MTNKEVKQKYLNQVGFIKQMIIARSGLHSVLRDQADWDYDMTDYNNDGSVVYEFSIYVTLNEVDCDECDYELDALTQTISHYRDKIYKSVLDISFDGQLKLVKNQDGQIWVTTPVINMRLGTLTIEFEIHFVTTDG
jgi:hypothetical protein